jgi:predicted permease
MKRSKRSEQNLSIESCLNTSLISGKKSQSLWVTIKRFINPPIYAAFFSIPLAFIPYSKEYFFSGKDALFANNLFLAIKTLGGTASPLINVLLGSNLSHGYPADHDISW